MVFLCESPKIQSVNRHSEVILYLNVSGLKTHREHFFSGIAQ